MFGLAKKKQPAPVKEVYAGHEHQMLGPESFAQCGEDLIVVNIFYLLGMSKPSYLDIGAHHPLHINNTALLYKRGSRGVVVEANPNLIQGYRDERPEDKILNLGVGPTRGKFPFYRFDETGGRNSFSKPLIDELLSFRPGAQIKDKIEVDVVTINDIVTEHCGGIFPDYLSLDTEGLDYEILFSADFKSSRPKVICVEYITGTKEPLMEKLSHILKDRGFYPHFRTPVNLIFVNEETRDKLSF